MVAGMVVGVADADVDHDPGEQLAQRGVGVGERGPDCVREVGVGGVAGHHLVQAEDRQRRHQQPPLPTVAGPVKALDEQDATAQRLDDLSRRHLQSYPAGQLHGDHLRLDRWVRVTR